LENPCYHSVQSPFSLHLLSKDEHEINKLILSPVFLEVYEAYSKIKTWLRRKVGSRGEKAAGSWRNQ
jgi:hypothetical protein